MRNVNIPCMTCEVRMCEPGSSRCRHCRHVEAKPRPVEIVDYEARTLRGAELQDWLFAKAAELNE